MWVYRSRVQSDEAAHAAAGKTLMMSESDVAADYVAMCEKFGPLNFEDFIDSLIGACLINPLGRCPGTA